MNNCPEAGDYDPVPAQFYSPNRSLVNQSPRVTGWTALCERHVRVMAAMTREALIQNRQANVGVQIFRVRRDDVTEAFTHELGLEWRSKRYAVTGVTYPNLAEIEIHTVLTTQVFSSN